MTVYSANKETLMRIYLKKISLFNLNAVIFSINTIKTSKLININSFENKFLLNKQLVDILIVVESKLFDKTE